MNSELAHEHLHEDISEVLAEFLIEPAGEVEVPREVEVSLVSEAVSQTADDLMAFTSRDAAALNDFEYVHQTYSSFRAVLMYRIAHLILSLGAVRGVSSALPFRTIARQITEKAKLQTGIEIHPAARIGRRFVIDHGAGTVIGEQSVIGDDCYFLQNVTLGGRAVADSSQIVGRRHPIVGDRVEIAGGVIICGPVRVGDNCRIEPGARITHDVPAGARVRVISTLQITMGGVKAPDVHGLYRVPSGFVVFGERLDALIPVLVDRDYRIIEALRVISSAEDRIEFSPPLNLKKNGRFFGLADSFSRLVCSVSSARALEKPLTR